MKLALECYGVRELAKLAPALVAASWLAAGCCAELLW
jgi:hypothetical protein